MQKVCSKCGENKDIEDFNKRKGGKYGCHAECKACLTKRAVSDKKKRNHLDRTEYKNYNAFINLTKKSKEDIKNLSVSEISRLYTILVKAIIQIDIEKNDDIFKQPKPEH